MLETDQTLLVELKDSIVAFDAARVREAVRKGVDTGIVPPSILSEMAKGMELVGKKFEDGEYFLSELIMAAEAMKEGMAIIEPYLKSEKVTKSARAVIGTVKGDLHDIGKNIVASLLRSSGFEVFDLGTDVSSAKFIRKIRETEADILAMSALLTTTIVEMGKVIKDLKNAKRRHLVKTIVGGAPIDEKFAKQIGADASTNDAIKGVQICKLWAENRK